MISFQTGQLPLTLIYWGADGGMEGAWWGFWCWWRTEHIFKYIQKAQFSRFSRSEVQPKIKRKSTSVFGATCGYLVAGFQFFRYHLMISALYGSNFSLLCCHFSPPASSKTLNKHCGYVGYAEHQSAAVWWERKQSQPSKFALSTSHTYRNGAGTHLLMGDGADDALSVYAFTPVRKALSDVHSHTKLYFLLQKQTWIIENSEEKCCISFPHVLFQDLMVLLV